MLESHRRTYQHGGQAPPSNRLDKVYCNLRKFIKVYWMISLTGEKEDWRRELNRILDALTLSGDALTRPGPKGPANMYIYIYMGMYMDIDVLVPK